MRRCRARRSGCARSKIGDHNYLGNSIYYPADGKTGANCLLAHQGHGADRRAGARERRAAGLACFEIPRIVDRDKRSKSAISDRGTARSRRRKTRYNVATMVGYLSSLWLWPNHSSGWWSRSCFTGTDGYLSLYALRLDRDRLHHPVLRPDGPGEPAVRPAEAANRVHVRPQLLVPRAALEVSADPPEPASTASSCSRARQSRTLAPRRREGRRRCSTTAACSSTRPCSRSATTPTSTRLRPQGHSLEEGVFKADYVRIGRHCTVGRGRSCTTASTSATTS